MGISKDKVEHLIQKEISLIVQNDVKDSKVGMTTITAVKLTGDMSHAVVYFSIHGNDVRKDVALEGLNKAKGFIKSDLANRIDIKKIPDLEFKYDDSLDKGNRIEELLEQVK